MKDAKSFFRYLIPGALFFLEAYALIWIYSRATGDDQLLWEFSDLLTKSNGAAEAVIMLVVSAVAGFVLATLHHNVLWPKWNKWRQQFGCDSLQQVLTDIVRGRYCVLRITPLDGTGETQLYDPLKMPGFGYVHAWRIITFIWHTNLKEGSINYNASGRMESLWDITHGLGSSLIGSAIQITVFVVALSCNSERIFEADGESWLIWFVLLLGWIVAKYIGLSRSSEHALCICRLVLIELLKGSCSYSKRGQLPQAPEFTIDARMLKKD